MRPRDDSDIRKKREKMQKTEILTVTILITMISMAPFNNILWARPTKPTIISRSTHSFDKSFEFDSVKYKVKFTIEYKVWSNGTAILDGNASATVGLGKLCVRMKRVISLSSMKSSTVETSGLMRKNIWGLLFVLSPGNETYYVRYDHPDNYDTYHPLQWNKPWQRWGNPPYQHYNHVHLSVQQVENLKDEEESKAEIMGYIYAGIIGASTAVVSWAAAKFFFPLLAAALGLSGTGAGVLIAIGLLALAGIFALINQYAQEQCGSLAEWVTDVVELVPGDGFMWWWDMKKYISVYITPPLMDGYWSNYGLWFTLHTVHMCEWKQSWGKDRLNATDYVSVSYDIPWKYPIAL